jgi:hypothetical protein
VQQIAHQTVTPAAAIIDKTAHNHIAAQHNTALATAPGIKASSNLPQHGQRVRGIIRAAARLFVTLEVAVEDVQLGAWAAQAQQHATNCMGNPLRNLRAALASELCSSP